MSKPFVVIALSGPKGAGKDTVADLLVTHCGFTKMAFGDALYAEVAEAFQIDEAQLRHRDTKEHPLSAMALRKCLADAFVGRMMRVHFDRHIALDLDAPRSPRQILQWWGTEYRRHQDLHYWTRRVSSIISYRLSRGLQNRFVVTDCRFDNEEEVIRQTHGGQIWQITRPGCDVPAGSHASETTGEAFKPDAVIQNNQDIKHLQQLVLGEFWAYDAGLEGVEVRVLDERSPA